MSQRPFHAGELDDADPLESAELLLMARELERLDGGAIRPSDGFTDRVLGAIADEPLPRPMAVAGVAAREGRLGAMVAALRDTWHVAWSGGRPLAARAQAMAFVAPSCRCRRLGRSRDDRRGDQRAVLHDEHARPSRREPSLPAVVSPSPTPTESPSPSPEVTPSTSPEPTKTAKPTPTATHTERPGHTETPNPTETDDRRRTAGAAAEVTAVTAARTHRTRSGRRRRRPSCPRLASEAGPGYARRVIVVVGDPSLRLAGESVTAEPDGPAAAIARACAAAGATVQLAGKVGDDPPGDEILLGLTRHGIGHVALLRDAGTVTSVGRSAAEPIADETVAPDDIAGADAEPEPEPRRRRRRRSGQARGAHVGSRARRPRPCPALPELVHGADRRAAAPAGDPRGGGR